jgi:hypothetical protein
VLEKTKLEQFSANGEEGTRDKRVDARHDSLEKALSGPTAPPSSERASSAKEEGGMVMREPFVVQDASGRTIFRVDTAMAMPREPGAGTAC